MIIKDFLSKQRASYYKGRRVKYIEGLKPFFSGSSTIISNNCLAGFIYKDLSLQYTSPTVGLYFFFPDYIHFLKNLDTYLYSKIWFVDNSKYELGNSRRVNAKQKYPIGLLNGDVEIHFLHYRNNKEAEDNWKRRADRVNLNRLIILGTQLDLCSGSDILTFDSLSFENKLFLTRQDYKLKSTVFIKEFENNVEIGDPLKNGDILYKSLATKIDSL